MMVRVVVRSPNSAPMLQPCAPCCYDRFVLSILWVRHLGAWQSNMARRTVPAAMSAVLKILHDRFASAESASSGWQLKSCVSVP